MRRSVVATLGLAFVAIASPALACGGLIGPRGSVNLLRTTTLAGYSHGEEHYLTAFQFAGAGGAFGSIVPLPGVPTKVERGGKWTLQRLVRETQPPLEAAGVGFARALSAPKAAEILIETKVDALDITVLKGGGDEVGIWAKQNGFNLPPDAPEVLDFYANRSPIFMAARFDASEAARRGVSLGDGTPIHLTIPTARPWVPLRILGLGKSSTETIQADVYLLTETKPRLLPAPNPGLGVLRNETASASLLTDLRNDDGGRWITDDMWLTYLRLDTSAGDLDYDLAISVDGSAPSRIDAGMRALDAIAAQIPSSPGWKLAMVFALAAATFLVSRRLVRPAA